jgi:hypothetical protein
MLGFDADKREVRSWQIVLQKSVVMVLWSFRREFERRH